MRTRTTEQKRKHAEAMRNWRANATPEQLETARDSTRRWRVNQTPAQMAARRNKDAEKRRRCKVLTIEQLILLEESQDNCCAICNKTAENNGKALAIDHDHETGQVRGLLCDTCNRGIGLLQDSPTLLRGAINYLTNPPVSSIMI